MNGGLDTEQICYTDVFQILTLYDSINVIDVDKVVAYVQSLQKEDGSFAGDIWGKPGLSTPYSEHLCLGSNPKISSCSIFSGPTKQLVYLE